MSKLKAHVFEIHINAEGDKLCLANPIDDDSGAYRIAGPKAWGGSRMVADIQIKELDLVTYIKDYAPHLVPIIAADLIEQQQARIAELEEKTSCCMGVGNGNGRLFVYGDHESIKTTQRYVLERDELATTVERLREQLSAMATQHQCGCGHPACNRCRDDVDNRDVLQATPQQNLNAIKREVAREAFIAGAKDAVAFISQQLRLGKTDIDLDAGLAADKYLSVKDGE